jgi:hypothetical protein
MPVLLVFLVRTAVIAGDPHPEWGMPRARPAEIFGTVSENYDVIIIGSGAGGGTLARASPPRASGSSHWSKQ